MADIDDIFSVTEEEIRDSILATVESLFPNAANRPDTREGSLFWTLTGPFVKELVLLYEDLNEVLKRSFITTTFGIYLDAKGLEVGVARDVATMSKGNVRFFGDAGTIIPVGTTVSTVTAEPGEDVFTFDTQSSNVLGTAYTVADRTIVETPTPAPRNQKTTITFTGTPTGGSFQIHTEAGGLTLNWDDTAIEAQAAIDAAFGTGKMLATEGPLPSNQLTIEYIGPLASAFLPSMYTLNNFLTGLNDPTPVYTTQYGSNGVAQAQPLPKNEVQSLVGTGTITGGTYTITHAGQTTSSINYNDIPAVVQSRLEALSTIGVGNVSVVSVSNSSHGLNLAPMQISFINLKGAQDVPLSTVTSSLTGTGSPNANIVTTTTSEPTSSTTITGTAQYAYTLVTPLGDPTSPDYEASYGETALSAPTATVNVVNGSVRLIISPVPELANLNEVTDIKIYRSFNTGSGFSDFKFVGLVSSQSAILTNNFMTWYDRVSNEDFEAETRVAPDENTTGVVELFAISNETGVLNNVPAKSIELLEDAIDGVSFINNPVAFAGGQDAESDDDYRIRLLEEVRKPIGAGNATDYKLWAKEVGGVEDATIIPEWQNFTTSFATFTGEGTVKLIVAGDNYEIPTYSLLEDVRMYVAGPAAIEAPYERAERLNTSNMSSATSGTGGSIGTGTYKYVYTFCNVGKGETPHSAVTPSTGTVDYTKTTNQTIASGSANVINLTNIPTGQTGVGTEATTARRIYRQKTGTAYAAQNLFYFVGEIPNNSTTTFVDTMSEADVVPTPNLNKYAPTTNSTSLYTGKAPIGSHVTVEAIQHVFYSVNATLVTEQGYTLYGTGTSTAVAPVLHANLSAYFLTLPAGSIIYFKDIENIIHDTPGVKDFRDVTIDGPDVTGAITNIQLTNSAQKAIYSSVGSIVEEQI